MPDRWCCCPACARADAARARPEERLTDGYRELMASTPAQLAATILPRMGSRLELLDQVLCPGDRLPMLADLARARAPGCQRAGRSHRLRHVGQPRRAGSGGPAPPRPDHGQGKPANADGGQPADRRPSRLRPRRRGRLEHPDSPGKPVGRAAAPGARAPAIDLSDPTVYIHRDDQRRALAGRLGLAADKADDLSRWALAYPDDSDTEDLRCRRIGSATWVALADEKLEMAERSGGQWACSSHRRSERKAGS
jgi:hypothetical protein